MNILRVGLIKGMIVGIMGVWSCTSTQQEESKVSFNAAIKINQIGYYPNAPKIAVIEGDLEADRFYVATADLENTLYTGSLGEKRESPYSSTVTHVADFSALKDTGNFVVVVSGLGKSYPFQISPDVHKSVAKGAIKGFYFQRVSTAIPEEFAGEWARPAGHPDTDVHIHASAVSANRPENTVIASPKGWYDAGDYNKYIVNSGITMGTLLSLYEDFPEYIEGLRVNIPEANNQIPDLLDEVLWNLRWMLTMQDPYDGGVYHKLTAARFEGMVKPEEAKSPRYVVQKSTTAALDFAAVMAQAARIFKGFDGQLPGLADSCLHASQEAWAWAKEHPNQLYHQREMNKTFDPDVTTGAYGDRSAKDEFVWAAAELFITTGEESYLADILWPAEAIDLPNWGQVGALGYYSLLRHQNMLENQYPEKVKILESSLVALADKLINPVAENAYATVMGGSVQDFTWGSNAEAANQGIALIQAYRLTGEQQYLQYALSNLDYLLGRNATGFAFVTGYGKKTPMHPHHRPSVSDDIKEPVPGLLVGGPNPGQQDECSGYPSKAADASYVDNDCSYASNEIAINWNAPFVYLSVALEALQQNLPTSRP